MFDIEELAGTISIYGIRAVEPEVARMVAEARGRGLDTASVDILGDPSQPEVARLRAFGLVGGRLDRHPAPAMV